MTTSKRKRRIAKKHKNQAKNAILSAIFITILLIALTYFVFMQSQ